MVNKVILIGNLGADPEVRHTQSGSAVTTVRLATTETYTKDGERQESTEWHRLVAFGRLAEIMGEYLSKGSKIYIEGRITTRQWDDRDGNKKYTTEIVVREMKMLSPKREQQQEQRNEEPPVPETHGAPMQDDVPFAPSFF